jgi:hypothetical protein
MTQSMLTDFEPLRKILCCPNTKTEFGWKQNEAGLYGDTSLFSQGGQSAHAFYEMSSHLSLLDRFMGGGEYFLDAGSGAIPHPEYLAYTRFYNYRICVDLSLTALQEAASKVGNKGFYCMRTYAGCHFATMCLTALYRATPSSTRPRVSSARGAGRAIQGAGSEEILMCHDRLEPWVYAMDGTENYSTD